MGRHLNWNDDYCPKGHNEWVFISSTILYSDLYWCPTCDCFYEPTVKKLTYDKLNMEFSTDRAADLRKRGEFLKWREGLTPRDMKEQPNAK